MGNEMWQNENSILQQQKIYSQNINISLIFTK